MKQIRLLSPLLLPLYILWGCGSAESIKCYSYPTRKNNLEKAVMKVLNNNPNIRVDNTTQRQMDSVMLANRSHWTPTDSVNYYNGLNAWIDVKIKVGESENYYLFRYRGDKRDWETSKISAILISTGRDKNGNTLNQGQNEHGEFKSKLAKDLTDVFEEEIVNKIDKELHLQHSNDCNY